MQCAHDTGNKLVTLFGITLLSFTLHYFNVCLQQITYHFYCHISPCTMCYNSNLALSRPFRDVMIPHVFTMTIGARASLKRKYGTVLR